MIKDKLHVQDQEHFKIFYKNLIVIVVISFLAVWLVLKLLSLDTLAYFFSFMVVSTTVIPVPTPPIILYAGHFFSPIIVAVVGGIASSIGCLLDYIIIGYTTDSKQFSKYKDHRFIVKMKSYFEKNGFFTLMFFALTPLPFEPVKVLAIISKYDVKLYVLAISVSRGIRYYILASVGAFLSLTQIVLLVIVVVILFIGSHSIQHLKKRIRETAE